MEDNPEKLQGTDGIRGRTASNQALGTSNPIDFFLKTNLLTPDFFERYTYAFATLLISSGLASLKDSVVIGWDPRDKEGQFNQAAIRGIRKAGLKAVVVGVLPTPAIPLYMQSISAKGGVVLTASHNPADQNGIKLFCGFTALKLLPPDDVALTKLILEQRKRDVNNLELQGELINQEAEAKDFFVRFCLDNRNSWIQDEKYPDTILVIDASNGAVAAVANEIFPRLPLREVILTNLTGNINETSGVADIEGLETITRESVMSQGAKFAAYKTLKKIFELAATLPTMAGESCKITAFVFDGDGDRCFRLDYIPDSDSINVSSGDLLGIHQARFILKSRSGVESHFVNTVESDLNTAITARKAGFKPILTGVGDKWILSRAVIDLIQSHLPAAENIRLELQHCLESTEGLSALSLSNLWKSVMEAGLPSQSRELTFGIGIEESGHCITPGYVDVGDQTLTCFSGNGIKTALNSMKAISDTVPLTNWYQNIIEPFTAGIRTTYYTYYVDKARLNPGSEFRNKLKQTILERYCEFFTAEFQIEIVEFAEEKEMLYGSILENQMQCGAIFVRNSGTEDKSALYLRGEKRLAVPLEKLGQELHLLMLSGLKNRSSEFTVLEINLLNSLRENHLIDQLLASDSSLPHERILKEIEFKEGLIRKVQGKYVLTAKGQQFIESWE